MMCRHVPIRPIGSYAPVNDKIRLMLDDALISSEIDVISEISTPCFTDTPKLTSPRIWWKNVKYRSGLTKSTVIPPLLEPPRWPSG